MPYREPDIPMQPAAYKHIFPLGRLRRKLLTFNNLYSKKLRHIPHHIPCIHHISLAVILPSPFAARHIDRSTGCCHLGHIRILLQLPNHGIPFFAEVVRGKGEDVLPVNANIVIDHIPVLHEERLRHNYEHHCHNKLNSGKEGPHFSSRQRIGMSPFHTHRRIESGDVVGRVYG